MSSKKNIEMVKEKEEKLIDMLEDSLLGGVFVSSIYFPTPKGILKISTPANLSSWQFLKKVYKIKQALKKYKPEEFYFAYTETTGNKYFFENIEKIVEEYGSIEAYPDKKSALQILHQTRSSQILYSRDIIFDNKGKCVDIHNFKKNRIRRSFSVFLPVYIVEEHWRKERTTKIKDNQKVKKHDVVKLNERVAMEMQREPFDILRVVKDYDFLYEDQLEYIEEMLPYLESFSTPVITIILDNIKVKELLGFIADIEQYYLVGTEPITFQNAVAKGDSGLYSGEIVLTRYMPFIEMYFHTKKSFPKLSLYLSGVSVSQIIELNGDIDRTM